MNSNNLKNIYLNYLSDESLKKVFLYIISFFNDLNEFEIKLVLKGGYKIKDIQIFCIDEKLRSYFGKIGHPFSIVVYKSYFSFYIRGKNNIFRSNDLCDNFINCHRNPSGEPIIKIKTQKDVNTLFKFIFNDILSLNIPKLESSYLKNNVQKNIEELNQDIVTEKIGLITSRVGQGTYRKKLLKKWNYKCSVTGINNIHILIASHIVPWKDADNFSRIDVNNGIILTPNLDALFDRFLISFNENGNILLSNTLSNEDYKKLGIHENMRLTQIDKKLNYYLKIHRSIFYDKNQ